MPHVTLGMTREAGPCLDIQVGVSNPRAEALKKAGQAIPPNMLVRGLIDTGASCSAIDVQIIKQLGMPATGTTGIQTPSTGPVSHTCTTYDASVVLVHPNFMFQIPALPVIAIKLSHQGIGALIGRDILKNCLLFYNGDVNRFALAF